MVAKCELCGKDFDFIIHDGENPPKPLICDECKPIFDELSNGKGDNENE